VIVVNEKIIVVTWTGKNKKEIEKSLKKINISASFEEESLYVDELGGYVEVGSEIAILPTFEKVFFANNAVLI